MPIREHYNHSIADAHKDKKREEAVIRQTARSKLSNKQQLAILKTRRGGSVRETNRLRRKCNVKKTNRQNI